LPRVRRFAEGPPACRGSAGLPRVRRRRERARSALCACDCLGRGRQDQTDTFTPRRGGLPRRMNVVGRDHPRRGDIGCSGAHQMSPRRWMKGRHDGPGPWCRGATTLLLLCQQRRIVPCGVRATGVGVNLRCDLGPVYGSESEPGAVHARQQPERWRKAERTAETGANAGVAGLASSSGVTLAPCTGPISHLGPCARDSNRSGWRKPERMPETGAERPGCPWSGHGAQGEAKPQRLGHFEDGGPGRVALVGQCLVEPVTAHAHAAGQFAHVP